MRRPLTRLPAALVLFASVSLASPALAATGSFDDETGDATPKGLDITRAVLDNGEDDIVIRVRFDDVRRGDLIVSVDPRGASGVRLISEYRPAGVTTHQVVAGAFSDGVARGGSEIECAGFRVRWNEDRNIARLRLPNSCLNTGDYTDVRFAVLTERGSGDADYAPDTQKGVSPFIARG